MSPVLVVGAGVVGAATGRALLAHGHGVAFVDASPARCEALRADGLAASNVLTLPDEPCLVLVCVPTPVNADGFVLDDLQSAVRAIGRAVKASNGSVLLTVRSTVPPGTCDGPVTEWLREEIGEDADRRVTVAHMPEFLRGASAEDDALNPRLTVIGASDAEAAEQLAELVRPFGADIVLTGSARAAELVKCAHNAYNATKISFWNEIHEMAERHGVDSHAVSAIVSRTAEGSWNPAYGIRGGRPYGGACLPKDVVGLARHASALGMDPVLLDAVHTRNERTVPVP